MPGGRPPVCPQLILAAFSVACQSGPVAPAVILRFLGHCHAGSAAKWGAGGVGGCEQGQGQGRRRAGSMAGMGVCEQRRQEYLGVCPASFLPAWGMWGGSPRPLVLKAACCLRRVRAPHLTAALGPPAAACDAAVPCRPVAPR